MKILCLAGLALSLISMPAAAKIDGCYYVTYSAAQLKRHPELAVAAVALQYAYSGSDEEDHDSLDIKMRKTNTIWSAGISCKGEETKLACTINEGRAGTKDGGSFVLTETATGVVISITNNLVFGAENDKLVDLDVARNTEHQRFTLLTDAECGHLF